MKEGDRHKTGSATTTCWQVQSEVMLYAWYSHRR